MQLAAHHAVCRLVLFTLLIASNVTLAQTTIEWTGIDDELWSNSLNWTPLDVPNTELELALITTGGLIEVDDNFEIGGLEITSPDAVVGIDPGRVLHYHGPTLLNQGTIRINHEDALGFTALRVWNDCVIDGNGRVELIGTPGAQVKLETGNGATITQTAAHAIAGYGEIRAQLVNEGVVAADASGETLRLFDFDKINNALFLATDGATLELTGVPVAQAPLGVVRAEDFGMARLSTCTVTGGKFESLTDGRFRVANVNASTLIDVVNEALIEFEGGAHLRIEGSTLLNDGALVLDFDDTTINTRLRFVTATMLAGAGSVELRNNSTLIVEPTVGLTHESGHRLRGEGFVNGTLINEGTIEPGLPTGTLIFDDQWEQTTSGRLELDVEGTTAGEFDRLVVANEVVLGGALEVQYLGGHLPSNGDSIEIIAAGSVVGEFDQVSLPFTSGPFTYAVRYEPTGVFLDAALQPFLLRGDCNQSLDVDVSDVVWMLGFLFPPSGTPNPIDCRDACDANDDGAVEISDAIELLSALFGLPATVLPAPIGSCGVDPTDDAIDCVSPMCL